MKFSDIRKEDWPSLAPYLDTCLLPVTGLTGEEEPWNATEALEQLRDLLDAVEVPFKGRVVTYPAFHYTEDESSGKTLETVCRRLKASGFSYVVIVKRGGSNGISALQPIESCDLLLTGGDHGAESMEEWRRAARDKVTAMWNGSALQNNL